MGAMFGSAGKRLDVNKAGTQANSYATGNRVYGGVSNSPNGGSALGPGGYNQRDQQASVKRNLLLQQRGKL